MLFVDGENFTIRGEDIATTAGISLETGRLYMPSTFLWIPRLQPRQLWTNPAWAVEEWAIRAYYYTSVQGDDDKLATTKDLLRRLDFQPEAFKKIGGKSKRVDISLTRDMLSHAYQRDYDVAVLVAGDRDYLPLVETVQRLGKIVHLMFFTGKESGLSEELRLTCDQFVDLTPHFTQEWKRGT